MTIAAIIAGILAIIGLLLCGAGIARLLRRRLISGFKLQGSGLVLLLFATSLFLISSNLLIYQRLTYEQPVATIEFVQKQPLLFDASVQPVDALARRFEMHGDEWQLDARVLKWHGVANLVGFDSHYRLHRLSGRYTSIDQERVASRSVYEITEGPEMDLWSIASDYGGLTGWLVDAAYGSAVYLPMVDGARYEIKISQNGLIARPMNNEAKRAVSRWIGL